jgi:hypothetical protein
VQSYIHDTSYSVSCGPVTVIVCVYERVCVYVCVWKIDFEFLIIQTSF